MAGIQRQVSRARLEDGQHPDNQVDGTLRAESDQPLRLRPPRAQPVCQAVRRAVQLGVGQAAGAVGDRDRVRVPRRRGREDLVQAPPVPLPRRPPVPFPRRRPGPRRAFGEVGQRRVRRLDGRGQQVQVAVQQVPGALGREQVGAVLGGHLQCRTDLVHLDRQVELGGAVVQWYRFDLGTFQPGVGAPRSLVGERDLGQRRPGQVTGRRQLRHQPLERDVLVFQRVEGGRVAAADQLPEGTVARPQPDRHGVGEEPDDILQRRVRPAGCRRGDEQVPAAGEPAQQDGERGEAHRVRRGARRDGQVADRREHTVRGTGRDAPAAVAAQGRAGVVGRQLQLGRHAGQATAPVAEQVGQHRRSGQVMLPAREVAVLQAQLRQQRAASGEAGLVELGQFAVEDVDGQPVRHHVVQDDGDQVAVLAGTEHQAAQQRGRAQVEVLGRQPFGPLPRHSLRVRVVAQVHQLQRGQRVGHAGGEPALHEMERRAQLLVPADEVLERTAQRRHLDRPAYPGRQRHVVGHPAGVQPVEEPQPLLAERRYRRRPGLPVQRRKPGRGTHVPTGDEPRQPAHRPGHEQVPKRQVEAVAGADPGDDAGRVQRVAAELGEVRGRVDGRDAEYLAPQRRQTAFERGRIGVGHRVYSWDLVGTGTDCCSVTRPDRWAGPRRC